jgi:signal transduction histidine kinase
MTLRAKLLLLIGLFCVLLILVASFLIARMSLSSYRKLEQQSIEHNLELASNILQASLDQLESSAAAYSYWEDTQHFVHDSYPEFLEDNGLLTNPPPGTDMDVMLLSDEHGDIKFANAYSSAGAQEVKNDVLEALRPYLPRSKSDDTVLKGALIVAGQPTLIVVSPLLDSAGNLPATGSMVALLYLNNQERLSKFGETVGTSLTLEMLEENSEDIQYAQAQWQNTPESLVLRTTPDLIKGYLRVSDIFEQPIFAWGVEAPRTIYQQGIENVAFLLGVLILLSVLMATAIIILLERIVLSRLGFLGQSVRQISESGDLTARTKLAGKDELSTLSQDINQLLSSLERQDKSLQTFNQELERSNQELEKFAYVASHDLQEPLRKVQAFSDRLSKKYQDLLDADGKLYIERIQDASQRMRILIQDLLAYSRIKTQGQAFESVDLNKIVRGVMSDLEVRLEESQGKVELSPLPIIQADPLQMRQIFQNLIGNALKFKKPDVPPIVKIYTDNQNIIVADNGIGFEAQYAERIFEVFQRLHGRGDYEGTGIGLSIVRKILERHGGSVRAESSPGDGAKFTLSFQEHLQSDNSLKQQPSEIQQHKDKERV